MLAADLQKEIAVKEERVNKLIKEKGLDGICLFKAANFHWFTAGGTNRVVTGSEKGCAVILIMEGKKYLISPSNEIDRLLAEQLPDQGFERCTFYWYETPMKVIKELAGDKRLGSDIAVPGMTEIGVDIDRLRFSLTSQEVEKARKIAEISSRETAALCASLKPGMTEYEIKALLSETLLREGINPAVLLVGTDERVFTCRHPVPVEKKLQKYALISLVGEKWGLHVTLTRAVYFGSLPEDLKKKQELVNRVDATFIANTVAGKMSDDVFNAGKEEYACVGYPDEWKMHHQGGAIGYAPREYRGGEGRNEKVIVNQMFGWNPTLQGTKSEDTILVNAKGIPTIITNVPGWWPTQEINVNDSIINRPMILEI